MTIRPFETGDLPGVLAVYAASKLDELRNEGRVPALVALDHDAERFATFQRSTVFVCGDTALLGYGACHGREITGLFVHPDARGQGLGGRLLAHLLDTHPRIDRLSVVASNAAAQTLYRRFGFEVVDTWMGRYHDQPVRVATMARSIAG